MDTKSYKGYETDEIHTSDISSTEELNIVGGESVTINGDLNLRRLKVEDVNELNFNGDVKSGRINIVGSGVEFNSVECRRLNAVGSHLYLDNLECKRLRSKGNRSIVKVDNKFKSEIIRINNIDLECQSIISDRSIRIKSGSSVSVKFSLSCGGTLWIQDKSDLSTKNLDARSKKIDSDCKITTSHKESDKNTYINTTNQEEYNIDNYIDDNSTQDNNQTSEEKSSIDKDTIRGLNNETIACCVLFEIANPEVSYEDMKNIIGGYPEILKILDEIETVDDGLRLQDRFESVNFNTHQENIIQSASDYRSNPDIGFSDITDKIEFNKTQNKVNPETLKAFLSECDTEDSRVEESFSL